MRDLAQRIFTIIKEPHLAGFATIAEESKPWVRYVTCHGSKDLTIRFSTFIGSRKVAQIKKNPEVHVTCGVTDLATLRLIYKSRRKRSSRLTKQNGKLFGTIA